jgi:hypothetical protein
MKHFTETRERLQLVFKMHARFNELTTTKTQFRHEKQLSADAASLPKNKSRLKAAFILDIRIEY